MAEIADVESAASWRSYKNNRYASLGARRIIRVLRDHFRTHRHVMRRDEDFERYAWTLFEELNDAGAFALMHCGVAEENERAAFDQANRRRRAKGLPIELTPEERDAERLELEQRNRLAVRAAMVAHEEKAARQRRERRKVVNEQAKHRRETLAA
jgi:hypothetical protein